MAPEQVTVEMHPKHKPGETHSLVHTEPSLRHDPKGAERQHLKHRHSASEESTLERQPIMVMP